MATVEEKLRKQTTALVRIYQQLHSTYRHFLITENKEWLENNLDKKSANEFLDIVNKYVEQQQQDYNNVTIASVTQEKIEDFSFSLDLTLKNLDSWGTNNSANPEAQDPNEFAKLIQGNIQTLRKKLIKITTPKQSFVKSIKNFIKSSWQDIKEDVSGKKKSPKSIPLLVDSIKNLQNTRQLSANDELDNFYNILIWQKDRHKLKDLNKILCKLEDSYYTASNGYGNTADATELSFDQRKDVLIKAQEELKSWAQNQEKILGQNLGETKKYKEIKNVISYLNKLPDVNKFEMPIDSSLIEEGPPKAPAPPPKELKWDASKELKKYHEEQNKNAFAELAFSLPQVPPRVVYPELPTPPSEPTSQAAERTIPPPVPPRPTGAALARLQEAALRLQKQTPPPVSRINEKQQTVAELKERYRTTLREFDPYYTQQAHGNSKKTKPGNAARLVDPKIAEIMALYQNASNPSQPKASVRPPTQHTTNPPRGRKF